MRPTHQPARAGHYRRPGGPWDTPPLDAVLADDARIAAVAGGLRHAGVRRGDAVAWQLPNVGDAVLLYRACWRLGAVAAPLHHQAGPAEVDRMLAAVQPRLVVDGDAVPQGRPVTTNAGRAADLAVTLFTSGSTGAPKAVLHTQRALAYKAQLMRDVHGLTPTMPCSCLRRWLTSRACSRHPRARRSTDAHRAHGQVGSRARTRAHREARDQLMIGRRRSSWGSCRRRASRPSASPASASSPAAARVSARPSSPRRASASARG